jgi:polar amino acid transport system substrate-binding protein
VLVNQSFKILSLLRPTLLIGFAYLQISTGYSQGTTTRIDILAEEFWPYSFSSDESNIPQGVFVDFAIELLDAAGLDYDLHMLPWPRVMRRATSDANQLVITVIRSADREDLFHWVGEVADVTHALYGLDTLNPVPKTLSDARSMSVATVVDDVASVYLEQNGFTNLTRTSDHLRGLELLTRGRVDLYPGNSLLIEYQCVQVPRGCDYLNLVLPLSELEQDLYFALSLGTAEEVVDSIRNQFTALIQNGRLDTLQRTFLESQSSDVMPD